MMTNFSPIENRDAGREEQGEPEMRSVIADFLEIGLVENVISLCKQQPEQIAVCADLVQDERMRVRLGVAVLFEELKTCCPDELKRAVPVLSSLCKDPTDWVRGEAACLLHQTGAPEALPLLQALQNDPSPQVAALMRDLMSDGCSDYDG